MTKRELIDDPKSCLNQAEDDEIVFLIRAKDPAMRFILEQWAWWRVAHSIDKYESPKIQEVFAIAGQAGEQHDARYAPQPQPKASE